MRGRPSLAPGHHDTEHARMSRTGAAREMIRKPKQRIPAEQGERHGLGCAHGHPVKIKGIDRDPRQGLAQSRHHGWIVRTPSAHKQTIQ